MLSDKRSPRFTAGEIDHRRRQLLIALALAPWLTGLPARAALPEPRIIALEWLPLEMLFALGVLPIAAADTHEYRLWVKEPALPASVLDIGLRSEPNLEFMAQLKPDLIVYSQGYGPHAQQLQKIAPTMELAFIDEEGQPLAKVRSGLLGLAERLGKMAEARAHLAWFDQQLAQARDQLVAWRQQPLLVFTLLDERHVVILGKRSLFGNVMQQLGIENAWQQQDSFWGTATVGIEHLAKLPALRAVCLDHGDEGLRSRVSASPLWQALPFVRQRTLRTVPAIWIFGSTLAALRFTHMLQQLDRIWQN